MLASLAFRRLLSVFMPAERDDSALVVTGRDQSRAEGVDEDVQDSKKSWRRTENKAGQCAKPPKIEPKSRLGERPLFYKKIGKSPTAMDGSDPPTVGKGRRTSGETANGKSRSRTRALACASSLPESSMMTRK